jgi:hypothetical protein
LSIAVGAVSELVFILGRTAVAVAPRESADVQGGVTSPVFFDAAPLAAATLLRLDMALVVLSLDVAYFLVLAVDEGGEIAGKKVKEDKDGIQEDESSCSLVFSAVLCSPDRLCTKSQTSNKSVDVGCEPVSLSRSRMPLALGFDGGTDSGADQPPACFEFGR